MNGEKSCNQLFDDYHLLSFKEEDIDERIEEAKKGRNYFQIYDRYRERMKEKYLRNGPIGLFGIMLIGPSVVEFIATDSLVYTNYLLRSMSSLIVPLSFSLVALLYGCEELLEKKKNNQLLTLKEKLSLIKSKFKEMCRLFGLTDHKARKQDIAAFEDIRTEFNVYIQENQEKIGCPVNYKENVLPKQIESLEEEQQQASSELYLMHEMLYPVDIEVGQSKPVQRRRVRRIS